MDKKPNWKKFRAPAFDSKSINKRMKKVETASTRHAHRFVVKRLASLRDARRKIIGWLVLIGALVLTVVAQMVWSQEEFRTQAAVDGGTYAEGMLGPIRTLNPLYAQTSAELSASRLLFSSLYDYDETGALRSDLAESMAVNDAGTLYTVKLRDDAKWHDGQNVTAEDIVFTVNTMKNPDARSVMQSSWSNVTVEAVDERTVTFTLPSPIGTFNHALTFGIIPKHILSTVNGGELRENSFSLSPIGSGPFAFRLLQGAGSDSASAVVYLTRNDDYYRGVPKLERFEIHSYEDSMSIVDAVKSRDVNAALDINDRINDIPERGYSIHTAPIESAVYALFNTQSPQLTDVTVRRALQAGTNVRELRESLSYKVDTFDLPVSEIQVRSNQLPSVPGYDKSRAETLLSDAGWVRGEDGVRSKDGQALELRLVAARNSDYKKVAEQLSANWSELGVRVETVIFDSARSNQSFAQSVLQPRAYDVLLNELTIGATADSFAYWHSSQSNNGSGLNFSNFRSNIADDALLSAYQRSEESIRDQRYRVFTEDWVSQAPAVGLYQSSLVYAQLSRIDSFQKGSVLPSAVDRYANVLYWTTDQAQVYKTP